MDESGLTTAAAPQQVRCQGVAPWTLDRASRAIAADGNPVALCQCKAELLEEGE